MVDEKENKKPNTNYMGKLYNAASFIKGETQNTLKNLSSLVPKVTDVNSFTSYVQSKVSETSVRIKTANDRVIKNEINIKEASVEYNNIYPEKEESYLNLTQPGKEPEFNHHEIYNKEQSNYFEGDRDTKAPEYDAEKYRQGELIANLVHGAVKNNLEFVNHKDSSRSEQKHNLITEAKSPKGPNNNPLAKKSSMIKLKTM